MILQSRAVTTLPSAAPGDDDWPPVTCPDVHPFDFWTQQDMGERWPDPIAPLTWSICEPMNQRIMDGTLAGLKVPYAGKIRWSIRAFGHVYMNEGALLKAYIHGLGMPLELVKSGLTHPGAIPKGPRGWRLGPALRHFGYFWRAATTWEKNVDRLEAAFPDIDRWVDDFMARDRSALSDAELLAESREVWFARTLTYVALHGNATALAMSSYDELERFVVSRGGDAALAQEFVGGITGIVAAEMVPALADMGATLKAAGLDGAVLGSAPAAALESLRAEPRAALFLNQLSAFLQRHGHRGAVEAELRPPRWCEAPEQVIEQLLPYLRAAVAPHLGGAAAKREAATAAFRGTLGWLGRAGFDRALTRAHRFTRMRDNGQGYVVRLLMPLRVLLTELGRRFAARGWLRDSDDL